MCIQWEQVGRFRLMQEARLGSLMVLGVDECNFRIVHAFTLPSHCEIEVFQYPIQLLTGFCVFFLDFKP